MKKITEGRVIIVPDSHQNIGFVNHILNKEKFDNVVFLGDWFDTFNQIDNKTHYSMEKTCEWINSKIDDDRFIWLLGNHDLSYLATYTRKIVPRSSKFCCSGWTKNKAKTFNKRINPEWFKKIELCCKVGDAYCVHAGFSNHQFKPCLSEEENIDHLYNEWERDKNSFLFNSDHWIGNIGPARRGTDRYSSPVWVDFFEEFIPLNDVRIICGHTNSRYNPYCKENSSGMENWCIDNDQKMYIIYEDGEFKITPIIL